MPLSDYRTTGSSGCNYCARACSRESLMQPGYLAFGTHCTESDILHCTHESPYSMLAQAYTPHCQSSAGGWPSTQPALMPEAAAAIEATKCTKRSMIRSSSFKRGRVRCPPCSGHALNLARSIHGWLCSFRDAKLARWIELPYRTSTRDVLTAHGNPKTRWLDTNAFPLV